MINTNKIEINEFSTRIEVNVETNEENKFTGLFLYNHENYGNSEEAIDLTDLLSKETNVEDFYITAEDAGITNFIGLYFLEFITDEKENKEECIFPDNTYTFAIGNLTKYHSYILDNILAIDIQDCNIVFKNKKECSNCINYLFVVNTLLDSLYIATMYGMYEEACRIVTNLDEICYNCTCYNKREITLNLSGIKWTTEEECITCNKIEKY